MSPLWLLELQLGINPKDQWVNKLLERMRTEEAKTKGRAIYSTYNSLGLEREFNTAISAQAAFVGKCKANPEDRVHLDKYLVRFPSIPGEWGSKTSRLLTLPSPPQEDLRPRCPQPKDRSLRPCLE